MSVQWRPRDKRKLEALAKCLAEWGPIKQRPRSGWSWSGGRYATKESRYGQRYHCLWCGRIALGLGSRNHWPRCPTVMEWEVG